MGGPLDGAWAKVERAKKHIADGGEISETFFKTSPYSIYFDYDADTDEQVGHVRVKGNPPSALALVIGDAVHNLRTALDYLAIELVHVNGRIAGTNTYFPVCWDSKEYESAFTRKVKGMSADAITLLDSMQPYHKGRFFDRDPLYVLHDLDVRDKHHALHVIGGAALGAHIELGNFGDDHYWKVDTQASPSAWVSPLKDGAPLFRIPGHIWRMAVAAHLTQADVHGETTFAVVVEEVRPGEEEAVIPLMTQSVEFVEGALRIFGKRFFP